MSGKSGSLRSDQFQTALSFHICWLSAVVPSFPMIDDASQHPA